MKFTVLGSGTGIPDAKRGPAGFLIQADGHNILVDGGSGTLQKLAKLNVDPIQLTAGIYSHWHPDHCGDLVPLLFAMHGVPGRQKDYPIYAGGGFDAFFRSLENAYGRWITPRNGRVVIDELTPDAGDHRLIGPVNLTTEPANHMEGSLHLRFEHNGCTVVFSGDTGPSDGLISLAQNSDLLTCECAGSNANPIAGHMTPKDIRDLVMEARPKHLWITHMYPGVTEGDLRDALSGTGIPWRRPDDLTTWPYSHSMVAGGLDEIS